MLKLVSFENDGTIDVNGTSFKGYVKTDYATLVEKFGEPTYAEGGDKTTVEWVIEFLTADEFGDEVAEIPGEVLSVLTTPSFVLTLFVQKSGEILLLLRGGDMLGFNATSASTKLNLGCFPHEFSFKSSGLLVS